MLAGMPNDLLQALVAKLCLPCMHHLSMSRENAALRTYVGENRHQVFVKC